MPRDAGNSTSSSFHGLTLIEALIALALIVALFSILLPALSSARTASHREACADNLRVIGQGWQTYLADHEREFPYVPLQPGWFYGGVRFSRVNGAAIPDYNRPLTAYLHLVQTSDYARVCTCCPGDHGIGAAAAAAGTGDRSAFESFGTSYRANAPLLDARLAGLGDVGRGMRRSEIRAFPAALVVAGDAVWYEVAESTGRNADWHGVPNAGNILFLDGSVQFMTITPRGTRGPLQFDPLMTFASGTSTTTAPASTPGHATPPDDRVQPEAHMPNR